MTELSAPFAPDWVLAPGESVLDLAEERGWTQGELAQRLGYSEKHISQLINGKGMLVVLMLILITILLSNLVTVSIIVELLIYS